MLGAMCYRNKMVVISKNFCTETTNFKKLDISDSKTNMYTYIHIWKNPERLSMIWELVWLSIKSHCTKKESLPLRISQGGYQNFNN